VLGAVRSGPRPTLSGRPVSGAADARYPACARENVCTVFLRNPRLDPRSVTDGLARLIFGSRGRGLWPILFDQSKAGATQALFAGVPFSRAGALPLAVYTFQYPWQEKDRAQPEISWKKCFLADIETALPTRVRAGVHWGSWLCAGQQRCSGSRIVKVVLYIIRGRPRATRR